jgi:hypothetical protein
MGVKWNEEEKKVLPVPSQVMQQAPTIGTDYWIP